LSILERLSLTETGSREGFDVDFSMVADRVADDSSAKIADWLKDITRHSREKAEWSRRFSQKEMQLREAHHRIKNNIASLESLLVMQSDALHNPEAAAALRDAVSRMESMRVLYDLLLISDDCSQVSVKEYVESLVDASISLFPSSSGILVHKQIDEFMLDSGRLASFGIIVNELLTNAMKYAFTGRKQGSIRVAVKRLAEQIILTVSDDGQGLPAGFDLKKSVGFGLSLVSLVSEQLGGSFTITSDHGTSNFVKICDDCKSGKAVKLEV
jgi:two-component sensor histidine kinase